MATENGMQQAFWIFPLLYIAAILAIAGLVITALWRIMKAQEATARALEHVAQAIARSGPSA